MPKPTSSAAGRAMPVAVVPEVPVQFGRLAIACAALRRHSVALDALRVQAEAEAAEFVRSRRDMERLIERLIDALDAEEGDADLEPYLSGFHQESRDDREGVSGHDDEDSESNDWDAEDSDPSGSDQGFPDDPDCDAPESYGRGLSDCQAIAASRERLFSPVTRDVLVTFKAGKLAQARTIGRRS